MKLSLQDLLTDEALQETRFSFVLLETLRLLRSERSDVLKISEALKFDPELIKKLLARINSPAFGLDRKVHDLTHAISLLGLERVREVLLQSTSTSFYHAFLKVEPQLLEVYKHSIAVACYAEQMARELRLLFPKEFYEAGIIHDLGRSHLLIHAPQSYPKLVREAQEMNIAITSLEKENLGLLHTELGAEIAELWDLPLESQLVIRYHHEISEEEKESLTTQQTHLVEIVQFANQIAAPGTSGPSKSMYRPLSSELPSPPGELHTGQLQRISEVAQTRYMEDLRQRGLV